MDKLLPCPFCGGEVKIVGKGINSYVKQWEINCVKCDLQMGGIYDGRKCLDDIKRNANGELTVHNGKLFLINDWNTRHNGWISVEDRLPNEDEGFVLVIANGFPKPNVELVGAYLLAEYVSESKTWILDGFPYWEDATVTHWMPLPQPPQEGQHF